MILSYFNLLILISFCSFSWSDTIKNDHIWPWTETKYLTRSNWSSLIIPNNNSSDHQPSIWFIFYYLNYCGYCKKAEPGWESIAQYATNWSKYIQIGAYDCASESELNNDICQDKKYPQWRIYCPLTNSTQLAFHSEKRTDKTKTEDILIWLLEKLNQTSHQCYGKSWPIQNIIEPDTIDDLGQMIPKNINKFQLFVSDDILHYTLYVLNNSKTVGIEPIYRLAKENNIVENTGIWKGIRDTNGEISLQSIDSEEIMKPFVINKKIVSHDEPIKENNSVILKPTFSDIDSAVIWILNRDLHRGLPDLIENVKDWINTLYTYYPGSNTIKNVLYDLNKFLMNHTTLSPTEFRNYVNSTPLLSLSERKYDHCSGSDASKRGYPCTLWVLFHSITIKQAILAEKNQLSSTIKPSSLLISIREFIRNFYLCDECVEHFVNMTSNIENEINSYYQSVIYLWQNHNIVNKRLRNDEYSSDPNWPKVPFPTKQQCNSCVKQTDGNGDALEYNENEIYQFLKEFYYIKNSARHFQYNYLLLFFIFVIHIFIFNKNI